MSFRVSVPESMGGELKVLPAGPVFATIEDIFLGESATKNPKATVKYILTSEMDGSKERDFSTIGEVVLESFSLQPQAMWRFNDLFKQATGERLPQGDYDKEEFEVMLKENLVGAEFELILEVGETDKGDPRTEVHSRSKVEKKKKVKK